MSFPKLPLEIQKQIFDQISAPNYIFEKSSWKDFPAVTKEALASRLFKSVAISTGVTKPEGVLQVSEPHKHDPRSVSLYNYSNSTRISLFKCPWNYSVSPNFLDAITDDEIKYIQQVVFLETTGKMPIDKIRTFLAKIDNPKLNMVFDGIPPPEMIEVYKEFAPRCESAELWNEPVFPEMLMGNVYPNMKSIAIHVELVPEDEDIFTFAKKAFPNLEVLKMPNIVAGESAVAIDSFCPKSLKQLSITICDVEEVSALSAESLPKIKKLEIIDYSEAKLLGDFDFDTLEQFGYHGSLYKLPVETVTKILQLPKLTSACFSYVDFNTFTGKHSKLVNLALCAEDLEPFNVGAVFPNLVQLRINHSQKLTSTDFVHDLPHLRTLDLQFNKISSVKPFKLESLSHLNLSSNPIEKLDTDFSEFPQLEVLKLASTSFEKADIKAPALLLLDLSFNEHLKEVAIVSKSLERLTVTESAIPAEQVSSWKDCLYEEKKVDYVGEDDFLAF